MPNILAYTNLEMICFGINYGFIKLYKTGLRGHYFQTFYDCNQFCNLAVWFVIFDHFKPSLVFFFLTITTNNFTKLITPAISFKYRLEVKERESVRQAE